MNPSIPTPSVMEGLIEKAKEDLAQRLSIPIGDISLVEATIVVWPDASIGCPQPGMLYKQVPEDGALIVLKTKEASYEYHNGGRRGLFLCEKAAAIPKKTPQLDTSILTPPIFNDNNNPPALTPDNSIPPGESQ